MARSSESRSASVAPSNLTARPWFAALIWAALFIAALLVYGPALHGDLVWDDSGHVTRTDLRALGGLVRIWFEVGATQQYYPVLHSAFWIEHRLWGDAVVGYHLLNVGLHVTAAVLFGLLLNRLAVRGAWLAAALFAFHPVCVESVAWISEQKNTLSAVFYLLAALAYLRFDRDRRPAQYAIATAWFLCALLTKTVTATLPAALLVVFWWQRGRLAWRSDVRLLLSWFVIGAISGLFTAHFEHQLIGAKGEDFTLDALQRGLLAGRVFWFYLGKLAWPADLIFVYPRWSIDATAVWQWLFPLAALALGGALAWWQRRSRAPLAALLIFAGTLFPVLGFVNVYPFLFSYVADHFQYLASLPILALAAAGIWQATAVLPTFGRYAIASALLAVLAALSWSQSAMYRDETTLWETTISRNPSAWLAYHNLAIIYANAGRAQDAIPMVEKVLQLRPNYALAENNLGDNLLRVGRTADAIPHFERAIRLQPNYAVAHCNLGLALASNGRTPEALDHFITAAKLDPTYADAELNWGIGLMLTDRFAEAIPHFERACTLDATPNSHLTFGRALVAQRRFDQAVGHLRTVIQRDPNSAEAHLNLALALRALGQTDEANEHFSAARQLGTP